MLTQERLKELLDYDPETGVFVWKVNKNRARAGATAGTKNNRLYTVIRIDRKDYTAHRLAWFYMYGTWPKDQLDHINRVRNDNRIGNLREATMQQNQWNPSKRKDNSSGYTGVGWHKKTEKWMAYIVINMKQKYLGLFNTPEEAHTAYVKAKEEHHNLV